MPVTRSSTSKLTSPSLKQSTLSFTSARRTASTAADKNKNKRPSASRTTSISSIRQAVEDSEDESSGSDIEEIFVKAPSPKRRKTGVTDGVAALRIGDLAASSVEGQTLDLQDKKGRWSKYYGDVREKMGNLQPAHAKGQTKIHHILRVFDLSYEYGPCIGVTRLERWERAQALGLNPPPEVREILLTKQGLEEDQFRETVFYGEA